MELTSCSGEVHAVGGIGRSLSVGQVVWAPVNEGMHQYLVFVGWPSETRKLGIKYCYNRACALYAVRAPTYKSEDKLLHPGQVHVLFSSRLIVLTPI